MKKTLLLSIMALFFTTAYSQEWNRGCRPKPEPVPPGSTWQVCKCPCNTVDGDVIMSCWVRIAPGSVPNDKNCSGIGGNCRTDDGRTGSFRRCRVN